MWWKINPEKPVTTRSYGCLWVLLQGLGSMPRVTESYSSIFSGSWLVQTYIVTSSCDLEASRSSTIGTGSLGTPPKLYCFCFPSFKNYLTVFVKKSLGNTVVYRGKYERGFCPLSCLIVFLRQFGEHPFSPLSVYLHTGMHYLHKVFEYPNEVRPQDLLFNIAVFLETFHTNSYRPSSFLSWAWSSILQ